MSRASTDPLAKARLAREEAGLLAKRGSGNEPQWLRPAWWDGFRSVRIHVGGRWIGLATTTYSYQLTQDEREEAAARIAALWSLAAARGWTTDQIVEGKV